MADIAVVFAFSLTELSAMSLAELVEWRERAEYVAEQTSDTVRAWPPLSPPSLPFACWLRLACCWCGH
ncbi:GpE family phage tail protein [uncultured Stenotrophomonas sp.]|uniref:GpE family phage tail protein n=1 Tax=uncultured Stenotrophomonas sp. TaxID=165438 RepID=UPI0028D0738C|nr:GpE family phage tail protein [uncultured Stenotrophomonas sp.]